MQTAYLSPLSSFWLSKQAINPSTSASALEAARLCHYTESTATPTTWMQPALFALLPKGNDKSLNKMASFRGKICFQLSLLIGQEARAELYGSVETNFELWKRNIQFIHNLLLLEDLWTLPMGVSPLCWDSSVSCTSTVYMYFFLTAVKESLPWLPKQVTEIHVPLLTWHLICLFIMYIVHGHFLLSSSSFATPRSTRGWTDWITKFLGKKCTAFPSLLK